MARTCSSCGVVTAAEARFCRHCGAVLRTATPPTQGETISPLAQTIPLDGAGLTTSSLSADGTGGSASDTQRIGRAELEHALRRSRPETVVDQREGREASAASADYAAPPTGELTPVAGLQAAAGPPAQTAGRRGVTSGPGRGWILVTGLLLVAFGGVAFAYWWLRPRVQENANEAALVANSNQTTETANATAAPTVVGDPDTGASNAGTPAEETKTPAPKPSVANEPPRDARERAERDQTTPASVTSAPTPMPTAAPIVQSRPTPPPAPSPVAGTGSGPLTAGADVFYFQAVNLVNGRDPRTLQRAELLRALQLFQNVRSGPYAAAASKEAERLGRELDRRRKYAQP